MILPTILETNLDETLQKVQMFEGVAPVVHIDIGDGAFVGLTSLFRPEDVMEKFNIKFQFHLLVNDPFFWIDKKFSQIDSVIFHAEVAQNYLETAKFFKDLGYKVGLCVNAQTPVPDFFEDIDFIQFMTIVPGAQGNAFLPEVESKITEFKLKFPNMKTQVDGGINEEHLRELKAIGVSNFAIGSAILKAADPVQEYKRLCLI